MDSICDHPYGNRRGAVGDRGHTDSSSTAIRSVESW